MRYDCRRLTQSLIDCKANLLQKTESLEHKQHLLEEVISERQRLTKEKRMLLDMIQNVQRDLEAASDNRIWDGCVYAVLILTSATF